MTEHKVLVPTPHISAPEGSFAKTVLMPGDPLRSQYIAQKFLTNTVLVNNVRGVQGYTGEYKGKKVSVMASGMGIPSIGIYSHELFTAYDVDNIIRVGSAGALMDNIKLKDIVVGVGASTNSNFALQFGLPGTIAPIGSYDLIKKTDKCATEMKIIDKVKFGNIFSSDTFYSDVHPDTKWAKMGCMAVEMEAAGLYLNAARAGKNALSICTISDQLVTNEHLSPDDRQSGFNEMIKLALEVAISE
jgi:purine-nucleoside phosphorylase